MTNRVIEAIERFKMLRGGETVTVGLSGGADSCALLCVLNELCERFGITLKACHINHNLRGTESDRDQHFAEELCVRLGITIKVYSVDVKGALRKHESIEEAARRLRYKCFDDITASGSIIATAHTASDNAETVLMNLIRGTGTKGLVGIPPVRGSFIRPLICCTREDTERYCEEQGIAYVTDSTNLIDDCTRNKVRHSVIPLLKEFNPSFVAAVSRMTEAVGEDEAFLAEYSAKCAEECRVTRAGHSGYDSRRLAELPDAVVFRIIASELKRCGVEPTRLRVTQCRGIIEKGMGKVNLCKNRFAYVRKKVFFVGTEEQNYRRISYGTQ